MPQFYLQPQDKPRHMVRRAVWSAIALAASIILLIVLAGIVNAPRHEAASVLEQVATPTTRITPMDKREAVARLERQAASSNPFGGAK